MAKSLWGDLSTLEIVRNPRSILQEQADELTRATGGVLEGRVVTLNTSGGLQHQLIVVVPALNDYSVTILLASHLADLYPVFVLSAIERNDKQGECIDETSFESELAERLSSPKVRTLLSRLKSMVVDE